MSFLFKQSISKQTDILAFLSYSVLMADIEGNVLFANDEAKSLFDDDDDLVGKNLTDFISKDLSVLLDVSGRMQIISVLDRIFELKTKKIANENIFLITINDITKSHNVLEELLNEDLKQSKLNHQKNMLLIKMSNHLKSPIHSINGFSQAILEGLGGNTDEKQRKYLQIIHKNSYELLSLVSKIVELSEVESLVKEKSLKTFNPLNAIELALKELKLNIEEKKISVVVDYNSFEKNTCYSDEEVFKKIIFNLTENAINSCEIGSVTIKLSSPDAVFLNEKGIMVASDYDAKNFLLTEIIDTGEGITAAEMADIFDPYLQVDKTTKKNLLRSLALKVVKNYIEMLGGKIWVESEVMKKTNFSFIIPIG